MLRKLSSASSADCEGVHAADNVAAKAARVGPAPSEAATSTCSVGRGARDGAAKASPRARRVTFAESASATGARTAHAAHEPSVCVPAGAQTMRVALGARVEDTSTRATVAETSAPVTTATPRECTSHEPSVCTAAVAQTMRGQFRACVQGDNPIHTVAVGDRRGRVRDASIAQGQSAVSIDWLRSESEVAGPHLQLDARVLTGMTPVARLFTFMPCEHQTISLGGHLAAVKALDGRMFWSLVGWIRTWCIASECAFGEQPDVYLVDFYDVRHIRTCLSEWGGLWQKRTLLCYRGTQPPAPPFPDATGSTTWHDVRHEDAVARAHSRDETPSAMARALVEQCLPSSRTDTLDASVEVERFAAAWHLAGLCVPQGYDSPTGMPSSLEGQRYLTVRGEGDGRRVPGGVVPRLALTKRELSVAGGTSPHRSLTGPAVPAGPNATIPPVTPRGLQLAVAAARKRASEVASAAALSLRTMDLSGHGGNVVAVVPSRREGARLMFCCHSGGHTQSWEAPCRVPPAKLQQRARRARRPQQSC